jgi:hypothetical protein
MTISSLFSASKCKCLYLRKSTKQPSKDSTGLLNEPVWWPLEEALQTNVSEYLTSPRMKSLLKKIQVLRFATCYLPDNKKRSYLLTGFLIMKSIFGIQEI